MPRLQAGERCTECVSEALPAESLTRVRLPRAQKPCILSSKHFTLYWIEKEGIKEERKKSVARLNLPPLPGGHGLTRPALATQLCFPRQMGSSPASSSSTATRVASPSSGPAQPSALEVRTINNLRRSRSQATERYGSMSYGGPSCKCYSFASCQNDQAGQVSEVMRSRGLLRAADRRVSSACHC